MTHKLIKTDNYLLVVDNSDPNKGDYTYNIDNGLISISDKVLSLSEMLSRKKIKKVLAHLPLNGSPVLEGVDLLPALEDDVLELAKTFCINLSDDEEESAILFFGFKKGYNKAREKYKYTEGDILKAIKMAKEVQRIPNTENDYEYAHNRDSIIQSLHQYPTEFECETEQIYYPANMPKEGEDRPSYRIKTTTINGRRTWVGKYK